MRGQAIQPEAQDGTCRQRPMSGRTGVRRRTGPCAGLRPPPGPPCPRVSRAQITPTRPIPPRPVHASSVPRRRAARSSAASDDGRPIARRSARPRGASRRMCQTVGVPAVQAFRQRLAATDPVGHLGCGVGSRACRKSPQTLLSICTSCRNPTRCREIVRFRETRLEDPSNVPGPAFAAGKMSALQRQKPTSAPKE
jgi:hypothetical protein